MPAKTYGYAENSADVDALQAYAGVDVILEDIQAARKAGRQFGRPAIDYPKDWKRVFEQWQARDISAIEACRKLKLSRSTFFRMAKRYQQKAIGGGD